MVELQCRKMESNAVVVVCIVIAAMVIIEASARVCYRSQEVYTNQDGTRGIKWVLDAPDLDVCTAVLLGGVNTQARAMEEYHAPVNATEPATVAMSTCNEVTLDVGSHETTPFLAVSLGDAAPFHWELNFRVSPLGGASQITKEIIHFFDSDVSNSVSNFRIEFSGDAVELYNHGGRLFRIPFSNGVTGHTLALQEDSLTVDATQATFATLDLAVIRFIQLESDSGVGAAWSLYDSPCVWMPA